MAPAGITGRSSIDYIERMGAVVAQDEDTYQIGQVLRKKKYFYLGISYRVFLIGLVLAIATFAIEIALS